MPNSETTIGQFKTEADACKHFDDTINDTGLFKLYSEVPGKMLYKRYWKDEKDDVRIDRILIPKDRLVKAGWDLGVVGVEIKQSNVKIGPPLAQATDYLDAVWFITKAQLAIHISHVFLYPCGELHNNIASVCSQNHLGQAEITHYFIRFKSGESTLFYYNITTDVITVRSNTNGRKVGSR